MENIDYTLEAGATRLFEAEKLARQMQEQEQKQLEEDELNPMKVMSFPHIGCFTSRNARKPVLGVSDQV